MTTRQISTYIALVLVLQGYDFEYIDALGVTR